MECREPELASKLLQECLRAGNVDGLESLYEPGAIFADFEDAVSGWPNIRSAHQRFLDEGLSLTLNDSVVFQADDIALVHWSWTVTQRNGASTDGASAEVLRRQPNGTWKFVIDNSDGSSLIGIL